jgi:hypothetical protein
MKIYSMDLMKMRKIEGRSRFFELPKNNFIGNKSKGVIRANKSK